MSKSIQLDEEAIKQSLEGILAEIHDTTDPEELNAYRALFRKYVPFFSRAYVAGYLLKKSKPFGDAVPSRKHVQAKEGMTSIFIGVGKSRKVFPRDIMSMILDQAGLTKDQVGSIKILDNYSFVEIANDSCQTVIDKLNNMEFRGRNIAVNFAKKRD